MPFGQTSTSFDHLLISPKYHHFTAQIQTESYLLPCFPPAGAAGLSNRAIVAELKFIALTVPFTSPQTSMASFVLLGFSLEPFR